MEKDEIFSNRLSILGKLAASIIHEIRSPLSVIKMNLDLLSMNGSNLSNEFLESLDFCKESVNRMNFIISNFSSFAKKDPKEDELVSINEITSVAVKIAQIDARMQGLEIITDLVQNIPLLRVCKDKLLQVFLNLIYNAMEAQNKEKNILIRTFIQNKKNLIWEIKDTGVGIDENSREKIFSEFYTSKEKGTGLGLFVCKSILDQYQSKIDFVSEINIGTKFFISFPIQELQL
jgi:signal transduction histidine kinase